MRIAGRAHQAKRTTSLAVKNKTITKWFVALKSALIDATGGEICIFGSNDILRLIWDGVLCKV